MALSKFKTEKRNKLYFNRFKYKAIARIVGVQYTYYTSDIDTYVNRIEKFKSSHPVNLLQKIYRDNDSIDYWNKIDYSNIEKYLIFRDTMSKDKIMSRICGDLVSFFSNDLNTFDYILHLDPNLTITEAQVLNKDTMYFKKQPRYKFRTYFRAKRMPKDFSDNVRTLQSMYSKDIMRFSSGLTRTLFHKSQYNPYRYMHGSHFVEYHDDKMLTILSMWFPDMLAKTYSLNKET